MNFIRKKSKLIEIELVLAKAKDILLVFRNQCNVKIKIKIKIERYFNLFQQLFLLKVKTNNFVFHSNSNTRDENALEILRLQRFKTVNIGYQLILQVYGLNFEKCVLVFWVYRKEKYVARSVKRNEEILKQTGSPDPLKMCALNKMITLHFNMGDKVEI